MRQIIIHVNIATSLMLALLVLSCQMANRTLVLIDHDGNLVTAKTVCGHQVNCRSDPSSQLEEFEFAVRSAFAAESACAGLKIANFATNKLPKASWLLQLTFDEQKSRQHWTIFEDGPTHFFKGDGTPVEIAHSACMVVKNLGATVE